jgi:hypothetical protein
MIVLLPDGVMLGQYDIVKESPVARKRCDRPIVCPRYASATAMTPFVASGAQSRLAAEDQSTEFLSRTI